MKKRSNKCKQGKFPYQDQVSQAFKYRRINNEIQKMMYWVCMGTDTWQSNVSIKRKGLKEETGIISNRLKM